MQLARHGDPRLTMAVYGRAQLLDLASAVDRLPSLLTQTPEAGQKVLQATGTEGRQAGGTDATRPATCTDLVQVGDGGSRNLRVVDAADEEGTADDGSLELDDLEGIAGGRGLVMAGEGSSPSRTRTYNKPVNRRACRPAEKHQKSRYGCSLPQLGRFASTAEHLQKHARRRGSTGRNPVVAGSPAVGHRRRGTASTSPA
jgi:hypothetical protein